MKRLDMVYLYDLYAPLFNDRQKEILDLYYNEDQSLAEISENVGITRQGVRSYIVKCESLLEEYEKALGLRARFAKIDKKLDDFIEKTEALNIDAELVKEIRDIKDMLL